MKIQTDRTQKQLSMLALRLQEDHRFMAWILEEYRKMEQITVDALAEKLDVTPERLTLLAVCKCPDRTAGIFSEQVRQIAAFTKANVAFLGNLIRQVDSLQIMADVSMDNLEPEISDRPALFPSGLMAAARDRIEEDEEQSKPPNTKELGDRCQNNE